MYNCIYVPYFKGGTDMTKKLVTILSTSLLVASLSSVTSVSANSSDVSPKVAEKSLISPQANSGWKNKWYRGKSLYKSYWKLSQQRYIYWGNGRKKDNRSSLLSISYFRTEKWHKLSTR